MRAVRLAAALFALAALLASCGIPVSNAPVPLPRSDVPEALVVSQSVEARCPSHNAKVENVSIYLVQAIQGDLVRVNRCVNRPATVQEVLKVLEAGPVATDYHNNYESALNVASNLVSVGPGTTGVGPCPRPAKPAGRCGLATIRLDHYFSELQREAPIQELGQIVWSLARSPLGVTEVRFLSPAGRPVAVETATGRFVDRPVTVNDHRFLGP